uniref:Uncharacterized protein n=1 Tax=Aureoumbra lagunensis TaxID=44058 RepID=A0A7S3JYX4_9STRA|mmetsp:Transcript_17992/g.27085  ORF Transcript_17992/g.27085 Transcript_17992/m.27085 type:complete len:415 (+) Transcript_17992:36-1280(+)
MFKKSSKRPLGQKLRQRVIDDESPVTFQNHRPAQFNNLSFVNEVEEEGAYYEKNKQIKKKGLFNKAAVTWEKIPSVPMSGPLYDAKSMASLRAAQAVAPPTDNIDMNDAANPEEKEMNGQDARLERAKRRAAMELDDSNEATEERGSESSGEDLDKHQEEAVNYIPLRTKFKNCSNLEEDLDMSYQVEDDDEEILAWEQHLTARGTGTSGAFNLKPQQRKEKQPIQPVDLRKVASDATESAEAARRSVEARQNEVLEHESALAAATADLAISRARIASLTTAKSLVMQAIALPPDQLRTALCRAVALAQDQDDQLGLGVYALDPSLSEDTAMVIERNDQPQHYSQGESSQEQQQDCSADNGADENIRRESTFTYGTISYQQPNHHRNNEAAAFNGVANADAAAALRGGLGFSFS